MISVLEVAKREKITSVVVSASAVFVGTEKGCILKCIIPRPSDEDTEVKGEVKVQVQLATKKPIQALAVIESISLVAALSDGCLFLLPFSLATAGHLLAKGITCLFGSETGLLGIVLVWRQWRWRISFDL